MTDAEIKKKLLLEYYEQRPIYEKIVDVAKAQIEYKLIKLRLKRKRWERLALTARVKEFESAFKKLKESKEANELKPTDSLGELNDMAALKIKVFPNYHLKAVHEIIMKLFSDVEEKHESKIEGLKYLVQLKPSLGINNRFEIQIVPFILDEFMDVEHDIIYKPTDLTKTIKAIIKKRMEPDRSRVISSVIDFSKTFETILKENKMP